MKVENKVNAGHTKFESYATRETLHTGLPCVRRIAD
jgi:hypothetical protein